MKFSLQISQQSEFFGATEGLRSENKFCGGGVNHWPGFSQLGSVLIANQTITTRRGKCSRETGNFSNISRGWAIMPVACKPKHDYQGLLGMGRGVVGVLMCLGAQLCRASPVGRCTARTYMCGPLRAGRRLLLRAGTPSPRFRES